MTARRARRFEAPQATARGYAHRGGGLVQNVPQLVTRRGTSVTLSEMFPWIAGGGAPQIGVPVGYRLDDKRRATMCCDPYSWFVADLIPVPSAFILGLPNRGKSTLLKRWILGLDAFGLIPQVFADRKGEYAPVIRAIGGVVLHLGRGRGVLNVLDMKEAVAAAKAIEAVGSDTAQAAAKALLADARTRREIAVVVVLTAHRGSALTEQEKDLVSVALNLLDVQWARSRKRVQPILSDLMALFDEPPVKLREAAQWRDDITVYNAATDKLRITLAGCCRKPGMGDVFNGQSTVSPPRDRPVVFDLSAVDRTDTALMSALQLTTWSIGFGNIAISHALSDAGLEPFRRYFTVQDEIWSALETPGMPDQHDALSRLDRSKGLVQAKASHTMADLDRIVDPVERMKAAGLVERSGMTIAAALPPSEHERLQTVTKYTPAELDMITQWAAPESWHAMMARTERGGAATDVVGRGNFMVKTSGLPGLPFHMKLTDDERRLSYTNERWAERSDAVEIGAAV